MNEAPVVHKERYKLGSDWELVNKVNNEWLRNFEAGAAKRKRSERNWRAYSGLEGGAWSDNDKDTLTRENRIAQIFNICGPKVDTLAGSLVSETFDFDWAPVQGVRTSCTEKVKDTYYIDKEMFDYESQIRLWARDACVMFGELKQEVTRRPNGLPYIRLTHKNPAFITRDEHWITQDDADCENLWEIYHLSAIDLARLYKAKGPIIENAVDLQRRQGGDWQPIANFYDQINRETKGHLYRVIEHHWLDTINTIRLVGRKRDSSLRLPFPVTDDKRRLEMFIVANNIDPYTVRETPFWDRVHMLTTICPGLVSDALLANGRSENQCGGRLPYFRLSCGRVNGEDLGVVDRLFHIQQTVDKREMKLTDLIATATGGGKLANKDAFPDPETRRELKENANDPSLLMFVDGDEMRKGELLQYINSNQFPHQIIDQLTRMYDIVDRLSGVPAAMESMTESAGESGVLYDRKLQMAKVALLLITKNFKQGNNNLGQAYYYQWRDTYNGPKRTWISQDGSRKVTLNERVAKGNGIYVRNCPAMTPRCAVIVKESPKSETRQASNRHTYSEIYKASAESHPEYATLMMNLLLKSFPNLDDKTKAKIEQLGLMQEFRDLAKLKADIANLDASTQQAILSMINAKMQMEQMSAQDQGEEIPLQETEEAGFPVNPPPEAEPAQPVVAAGPPPPPGAG